MLLYQSINGWTGVRIKDGGLRLLASRKVVDMRFSTNVHYPMPSSSMVPRMFRFFHVYGLIMMANWDRYGVRG
jgi:hypothetical protein